MTDWGTIYNSYLKKKQDHDYPAWKADQKTSKEHCANKAMDDWEDKNLPIQQRRKPRMLCCPCSECRTITC